MVKPGRVGGVVCALLVGALVAARDGPAARATSGGDPYRVPPAVDVNPDPRVMETTIVARTATVDVGDGIIARADTFNGTIPGPEIRAKVGDTVIVHFRNRLAEATAIHWHGVELNAVSDGTPLTQNAVEPGGSYLYRFEIRRPGIFWYHPHGRGSTNQVFKGLYGSLIVADPHEAAVVGTGVLPGAGATRTLMLADTTVCKRPGANDTRTYDASLPWVGGGPLPVQPPPMPAHLCETPIDDDGHPIVDRNGEPIPLAAGDIPNIQPAEHSGRVNEGQTVLTNGRNVGGRAGSPRAPGALSPGAATLEVRRGQALRFQLVNAATIRYFRLRLTTATGAQIPLVRVGGESGLLDRAVVEGGTPQSFDTKYGRGEILLAPGDRADVVAAIPADAAGVATMWTQDFARTGLGFARLPTVPVMHLDVRGPAGGDDGISAGTPLLRAVGAEVEALGPATSPLLDPAQFPVPKRGSAEETVRFTNQNFVLGIDNVHGIHDAHPRTTPPHIPSTRYARIGDTLELSVTNETSSHHPFHLHGFAFQPLSFSKPGSPSYVFPYREFVDEVDVYPQYTLTFRVRLDDRPLMDGVTPGGGLGRWMFHCHIFFHSERGMASELVVVRDATGNEKPDVNADEAWASVSEGRRASMTGMHHDLDDDPVSLDASVGRVADNGDGTWTWTFTPTDVGQSQTVYITATDAAGNRGQHGFDLVVSEPDCPSRRATIVGTPGDDHLVATDGSEVIVGLGGDDRIAGSSQSDVICGGGGDDHITGGGGNDVLSGGTGGDDLAGGPGHDVLRGDDGPDRCSGGPGEDTLVTCEASGA